LTLAACATKPPPSELASDACENLASSYELVARNRDLGLSKRQSVELLRRAGGSSTHRGAYLHVRNAIELAYRYADADSARIRAIVLADCEIDAEGQASLRTLWPGDHIGEGGAS
jgi:hypothetical protein